MMKRRSYFTGVIVSVFFLVFGAIAQPAYSELQGDLDGNGEITTEDAIYGLQVTAGQDVPVSLAGDGNGDGLIGLEEVLYLLNHLGGPPPGLPRATMYVDGRWLHDRFGERVVLRGANSGVAFPAPLDNHQELAELAKTGANAVRLTFRWRFNRSTPEIVDRALTAARDNGLIAIPSIWEATGTWKNLGFCVDFWATPEMAAVLRKHEAYTVLNIANEAGNIDVTDEQFKTEYTTAVNKLRAAGLHMPLVIDAAHWGRGENYILDNGNYLVEQDPEHNLMFSWHTWDPHVPADPNNPYDPEDPNHVRLKQRLSDGIDQAIEQDLCMIIGEFAWKDVFHNHPIAYKHILEYSQERQTGWLYWWWYTTTDTDTHAMTSDGIYGNWVHAGEEVSVTSPYSIANTSVRTPYMQDLAAGKLEVPLLSLPVVPTNLVATPVAGTRVDVSWQDNSNDELDFFVEIRPEGEQDWLLAKTMPADSEKAVIGGNNSFFTGRPRVYEWDGNPDSSPIDLSYDTTYEIRVGAYKGYEVVSYSEPVEVTTLSNPSQPLAGTGLKGEYFYMEQSQPQNFDDYTDGPVLTRTDPMIDFDWEYSCPDVSLMGVDHFQIRWTGTITPQFSGLYSIYTDSDDFARVYINDELLFDHWYGGAQNWYQSNIELVAGQEYDIRVEYREWDRRAYMHLYWASAELQREVIPASRMQPAP